MLSWARNLREMIMQIRERVLPYQYPGRALVLLISCRRLRLIGSLLSRCKQR